MNIFVYPGSFDPVTFGHIDIIERSAKICDKLIVAVGDNRSKTPLFTADERIELLRESVKHLPSVEVAKFSGLLTEFAKNNEARTIIKGLRAMSDFEYEFQMALLNKKLEAGIETLFMMTNVFYSFVSSSGIKEVARHGGKVDGLVPEFVREELYKKYRG